jgi:oligopeptidase B
MHGQRLATLFLLIGAAVATQAADSATTSAVPKPPVAERRPHDVVSANGTRQDPYYWLRDDTRTNPDMLRYLAAENAYYDAMAAPFRGLAETLEKEIRGRLKQDDSTVPYKYKDYLYHTRYEAGKEYPVYVRGFWDLEQVLLDANQAAAGKEFYQSGHVVSPDQKLLAVLEDTVGRRQFTLRFQEIATGKVYPERITGLRNSAAWANDNATLYYIENDPVTLLSTRVKKHVLGTDPKTDPVVYEEKDTSFYISVDKTRDERYVVIGLGSTTGSESRVLDADDPRSGMKLIAPREHELLYEADHVNGRWMIRTNLDAPNYRLMTVADAEVGDHRSWKELLPYDPSVFVEGFVGFRDFLAINERSQGLLRIRVMPWGAPEKAFAVASDEPAYAEQFSVNAEQDTHKLRYSHTSLTTPDSIYEVDMGTGERVLLKRQPVLGGYDPANYASERVFATARDGTRIPVSVAYRKGLKKDGTAPLYQYAYGSYGASSDPEFESSLVSLLDRGFVYAIAHVRGGQELGRAWYEAGRQRKKVNTFTDFIDVTDFLVAEKYAAKDKVFAQGASAGGLLMGAVANMAPEKYRAILAHVPYVDAVTTMLDESIPLVSNEFDEWGNPKQKADYDYMLSYSPYDNVKAQAYPAMRVTTGLHDSQVQYYEPTKWVARLRATKTDHNPLLFKINMSAGHGGRSGRFERVKDTAEEYAFILSLLGSGKEP